jgi:hypothetical protein
VAEEVTVVERLESKYGPDCMPRFLKTGHALKGRQPPTIHEVIYHFSLAAGEDFGPVYRKLGIAYQPPPAIRPDKLKRKLQVYRQKP